MESMYCAEETKGSNNHMLLKSKAALPALCHGMLRGTRLPLVTPSSGSRKCREARSSLVLNCHTKSHVLYIYTSKQKYKGVYLLNFKMHNFILFATE